MSLSLGAKNMMIYQCLGYARKYSRCLSKIMLDAERGRAEAAGGQDVEHCDSQKSQAWRGGNSGSARLVGSCGTHHRIVGEVSKPRLLVRNPRLPPTSYVIYRRSI